MDSIAYMTPAPNDHTTHLLYLHGFRSSPLSAKAQQFAACAAAINAREPGRLHWCCPQLPPSPAAAAALLLELTADWPNASMAVVGSSLGGFYASWLAEQRGCRAVLLNPAVNPARDLARHLGEQTLWHDPQQTIFFQAAYLDELRALQTGAPRQPGKLLSVIAKGDELLDWREMLARYPNTRQLLLDGSDHGLSDFERYLTLLLDFLGLR